MKRKRQPKKPISQVISYLIILVASLGIVISLDLSLAAKVALIIVITVIAIFVACYGEVDDDDDGIKFV